MEDEAGGEESFDSIPRPEYERIKAVNNNSASDSPTEIGFGIDDGNHLEERYNKKKTLNAIEAYDNNDEYDASDDSENGDDDSLVKRDVETKIKQTVDSTKNNVIIIRPLNTPFIAEGAAQKDQYKEATNDMNCKSNLQDEPNTDIEDISTDLNGRSVNSDLIGERRQILSMHKAKKKNHKSSKKEGRDRGISTIMLRENVPAGTSNRVESVPKMLTAKMKNNKMIMVQLIADAKTVNNDVETLPIATTTLISSVTTDTMTKPTLTTTSPEKVTPIKISMVTSAEVHTEPSPPAAQQQQQTQHKAMSREFIALQRSVKESKVLRNFVSATSVVKMRKRRKSGSTQNFANNSTDGETGSAMLALGKNNEEDDATMNYVTMPMPYQRQNSYGPGEKRRKFIALKDDDSNSGNALKIKRSRSKSVTEVKLTNWPSDDAIVMKRTNMRSQNSDFVQKQRDFLQRVRHQEGDVEDITDVEDYNDNQSLAVTEDDDANSLLSGTTINYGLTHSLYNHHALDHSAGTISRNDSVGGDAEDSVDADVETAASTAYRNNIETRLKDIWQPAPKAGWDSFCWKCRDCGNLIPCTKCYRCYHTTCIKMTAAFKLDITTWICNECTVVDNVLNGPKRLRRHEFSHDMLSQLLSFALNRMKNVKGYTKQALHEDDFVNHSKYIVNPVTFDTLQDKIEKKIFRCAEEFVNDTKWILHNALILTYGTPNSKEVLLAKSILKVCRQEANEIDTCPECYLNANTRPDWFVDVCTQPHLLVWAKLKGFPYWPAKAMGLGQGSHVNVRFFGEHDRAFVPVKDCFLYSEQDPNMQTGKRLARELADCIDEVKVHIEKIRSKIGDFKYAQYRTPYDPNDELAQLELMVPGVGEYMRRQQALTSKPSLQYKIVKTAGNHLSIIKKPAVASESGNDSDTTHSSTTPGRKRPEKADSVEKDVTPSNSGSSSTSTKSKSNTSKYEVISKTNSDDSNSSKVSTVILKRKSISNSTEGKRNEDAKIDVSAKQPKVDNCSETGAVIEDVSGGDSIMELSETHRVDKPKSKSQTPKNQEPRVPLLTLKRSINRKASETTEKTVSPPATYQKTVEQLVKHTHGVTIKKISKDVNKTMSSRSIITTAITTATTSTTSKAAIQATSGGNATIEESTNCSSSNNANVENTTLSSETKKNLFFEGLVPFIEPKKEILSDEEYDAVIPEVPPATTKAAVKTLDAIGETTSTLVPAAAQDLPIPELLTTIKQEVLSDDEQPHIEFSAENVATTATTVDESLMASDATTLSDELPATESASLTPQPQTTQENVRVVGGTTIQRIMSKSVGDLSASATTQQPRQHHHTNMSGNSVGNTRRSTIRGVPYGPLPASAMPSASTASKTALPLPSSTGSNTNSQNNSDNVAGSITTTSRQRARKSFPNSSSASDIGSNGAQSNAFEQRPLKTTSMVSIPVDAAANRVVPVPPLTAVTKTLPSGNGSTTTQPQTSAIVVAATVAAVGVAISNASAQQQTQPLQQPPQTQSAPPPPLPSTTTSTTYSNGSVSAALLMSAPPPLAGLSQTPPNSAASSTTTANNTVDTSAGGGDGGSGDASTDSHLLADLVTPGLAEAITDIICRGPPRMMPRPNGPLQSDGSNMFPSQAGPLCRTFVENAHKLTDFFISVMEDTMREVSDGDDNTALLSKITLLTMELERKTQAHEKEVTDLKRSSDLMLCEMRKSMENERIRLISEVRKQCEQERLRSIEETKAKQWCSNCWREAQFYCCWNTSYCDYPCQQLHWPHHASSCAQTRPAVSSIETTNHKQVPASNSSSTQQQNESRTNVETRKLSGSSSATIIAHSTQKSSSSKKDKHHHASHNKMAQNMNISAPAGALVSTSHGAQTPPEILKLPQNTYLRPVTASAVGNSNGIVGVNSTSNNSSLRNNVGTFVPYPVQRFNIPLPITAPVHTNSPYTLVQRGNNWELRPTSAPITNINAPSSVGSNNIQSSTVVSGSNMATLANTPLGNITTPTIQQQQLQHHHHHHTHHNTLQQQTRLASGATITSNIKFNNNNSSSSNSTRGRNTNIITPVNLHSGNNSSGSHMRPINQM